MPYIYLALMLTHVASFAIWMGVLVASYLVVRTFEPRLTALDSPTAEADGELLRAYIRREFKLIDVVFPTMLISGILLAQFFFGWRTWVFIKLGLVTAQFAATMFIVFTRIRSISYPCPKETYRQWYQLFAVLFGFFSVTLLVVYFAK
jgi:hypothetical protein